MNRYIQGVVFGDLWNGGRGARAFTVTIADRMRVYDAIDEIRTRTDVFKPNTKSFGLNTQIVYETTRTKFRGSCRTEHVVRRAFCISDVPSLAHHVEPTR